MSNSIPFNPKDVAYLISWTDINARDCEGYTVVKPLDVLASGKVLYRRSTNNSNHPHWLSMSEPSVQQFNSLDAFLGEKTQRWVKSSDRLPNRRRLDDEELKKMFGAVRDKIAVYDPKTMIYLLKMFVPK